MKYPKNSLYNWRSFPTKTFKIRQCLTLDILHDFLITSDVFHHMNNLLNVGNKTNSDFWSVEPDYKGATKLFTLGMIANVEHQKVLLDLIYKMAYANIGDKDFDARAAEIESAMRKKILKLAKTSVSV